MATTGTNFVYVTGSNPVLNGSTVQTPPFLDTYGPKEAMVVSALDQVAGGSGAATNTTNTVIDRLTYDPSVTVSPSVGTPPQVPEAYGTYLGAYAKNGAVYLALSGTTAQTLDLNLTSTGPPASYVGDTVFATVNVLRVKNLGTAAVTIAPGSSNASPIPELGGTTPTLTLDAGSEVLFHSAAGQTITSSACNVKFTPAATTNICVTISGS